MFGTEKGGFSDYFSEKRKKALPKFWPFEYVNCFLHKNSDKECDEGNIASSERRRLI
jgi:hypothetical protein